MGISKLGWLRLVIPSEVKRHYKNKRGKDPSNIENKTHCYQLVKFYLSKTEALEDMDKELAQRITLRREIEQLAAELAEAFQRATQPTAPDVAAGRVGKQGCPYVQGNWRWTDGKRVDCPCGVRDGADRTQGRRREVRFAIRYIHPKEGKAWNIGQVMHHYSTREEFGRGILIQFPQKERWEECFGEAERYQDASFEEWLHSEKAVRMNFTILNEWSFPEDRSFSVTMSCLAATMVGSTVDKYRVGG